MLVIKKKKIKVCVVRRHDGSLCTQKQPETAALKAAIKTSDPMGGQSAMLVKSMFTATLLPAFPCDMSFQSFLQDISLAKGMLVL